MAVNYGVEPSVSIEVEVAFAANPWDTSPVYTSVASRVRYIRTFRGKTSVDSEFAPATLEVVLGSRDRRFDPENATGPYFGQLLPMKRVRVTVTRAGVAFVLFVGWTLGWEQNWGRVDNTVHLTAIDGTDAALNATLPNSAYEDEVLADSPTAYWSLQNGELTSSLAGGITLTDGSQSAVYASVTPSTYQVIDGTYPVGGSDMLATLPVDSYRYEDRGLSLSAPVTAMEAWVYDTQNLVIQAAFSTTEYFKFLFDSAGANGFTIAYRDAAGVLYWNDGLVGPPYEPVNNRAIHHIAAWRSGSNIVVMVDGTVQVTTALTAGAVGSVTQAGISIAATSTNTTYDTTPAVAHLAVYQTAPSEARFALHYQVGRYAYTGAHGVYGFELGGARIGRILDDIGFPSNLRDISTGGTRQGAYRPAARQAIDAIREVERSEQGLFFFDVNGKAMFRDRQWLWVSANADGVIFSDDGAPGAVRYRGGSPNSKDIATVRNKITVSWESGAITNKDATSIAAYRERGEFIDCSGTIGDAQTASDIGRYRLRISKDPATTVPALSVPMRRDIAATFAKVCGLELGDVVLVERTPVGGGAQTQRRHMAIGMAHEITRREWNVALSLAPADPMYDQANYLTLGHATLGRIGAAAANVIPF